ncbi:hypothetical protein T440DRAFT_148190 [Plenodomus tracheiphilus IPT5]|uniref:Low temperature requirement A n=1 Tax=Plenodomus tracheiphilus IPT5 TaxID=1408161 RepID=A0A6A7B0D0_9PLEO|nr:hypothetical protein T440DRAFT_148190 [Plenodomus tracheiphilus IPT5]
MLILNYFSVTSTDPKPHVDNEKHLAQLHKTTPLIESPLAGADHDSLVFSQRHEANSVELFFDLFFVANLATFTAYHSITDGDYLLGYIGFFGILWSSWFQITLHDVRFARDSLYERVCKTVQFITFVGLALVGSQFNPASAKGKGNNTSFRILCLVLVISRGLLAIQNMVVLFFTYRARYSKLYLPLGLIIDTYAIAAGVFAGMTPAFKTADQSKRLVYLVWYATMGLEALAVIGISCFWRMLSFKKTHLMERMSLLTIIVIGEGAIGVTKTVGKIMKIGLEVEGCFLIMCIIITLVLLWALYFDNFPHGHYGTIRQQFWSLLHFPYHLAIVGVVEDSQQLALSRYVQRNALFIRNNIDQCCQVKNLDGKALQESLLTLLKKFKLDGSLATETYDTQVKNAIYRIGNSTGICSPTNATAYHWSKLATEAASWPNDFIEVNYGISNGIFTGLGMKIPIDKLEKYTPLEVALQAWKIVYLYYWSCFVVLILCSIVFLVLIKRHKTDMFDYASLVSRCLALGIGGAMIGLYADKDILYGALKSPMLLPICVIVLFFILLVDKVTSLWSNARLQNSGEPYVLEEAGEHGHGGHEGGHGEVHEAVHHGHANHESGGGLVDVAKQSRWSTHVDMLPLSSPNSERTTSPFAQY